MNNQNNRRQIYKNIRKIRTARFIQLGIIVIFVLLELLVKHFTMDIGALTIMFAGEIILHFYIYANMYCPLCGERFSLYSRYIMPPDICPHCGKQLYKEK